MASKSKKPSGLSITRSTNTYTFKWKIGDKNYGGGQTLQYRLKVNGSWKSWTAISIGNSVTSKAITISPSSYYPNNSSKLQAVEFRVKGKRTNYAYSDFTNCSFEFDVPNTPAISCSLGSQSNVTNSTWSITTSTTDKRVYAKYEYQAILVDDSNETDGSKLTWSTSNSGWKTGTGTTTSGTITLTENSTAISSGSHTRWIRIRGRGLAGDSNWKYAKHVFSIPYTADIQEVTAVKKSTGYLVDVTWVASANASHPIDETSVYYSNAVPIANMQPPASPSWTEANISRDTSGTDRAVFTTSGLLQNDECLWVKVVTTHDSRDATSEVLMAQKGELANPTNLSVSLSGRNATVNVTNNSTACVYTGSDTSVKRLFTQVIYRGKNEYTDGINIGVIASSSSSKVITIPDQTNETAYTIGVRSVVGTYESQTMTDGTYRYSINEYMSSDTIWTTADIPVAPKNVKATYDGNLTVQWEWSWQSADSVEISWSEHENAWNSTEEPDTYEIDHQVTNWVVKNIEAGKKYYIKVRLKSNDVFGPYSETAVIDLTMPPQKPSPKLSAGSITRTGNVTLSWSYVSNDGTEQVYAEIKCSNQIIAHCTSEKHITLYAEDLGWTAGTYSLTVRVKSASGSFSDWSDSVSVQVISPLTAVIYQDSLTNVTVTDDTSITRTVLSLTTMPMTVTVTGAGKGLTTVAIERAEAYDMIRPDDTSYEGFEGETIYLLKQYGEDQISIATSDLIGSFDDGAKYRIVATVSDELGQSSTATKDFEVHWSHQAIMPTGTVALENTIAKLSASAPTGTTTGDVLDIYRLSKDRPELVYPDASFGTVYVDPYPAIGGGYRFVFKTANGDYITSANIPAWDDVDSGFDYDKAIIEFGTDKVELYYNVDANHTWSKDFTETKYLGGSVQGDWNPAVSRTSSVSAVTMNLSDQDTITALRRLAVYSGICNIRTLDGSSFHANIDVTENNPHDRYGLISEFTLNITRVDAQGYDGIPYANWSE